MYSAKLVSVAWPGTQKHCARGTLKEALYQTHFPLIFLPVERLISCIMSCLNDKIDQVYRQIYVNQISTFCTFKIYSLKPMRKTTVLYNDIQNTNCSKI